MSPKENEQRLEHERDLALGANMSRDSIRAEVAELRKQVFYQNQILLLLSRIVLYHGAISNPETSKEFSGIIPAHAAAIKKIEELLGGPL